MTSELVSSWFGEAFSKLAPELQTLHCDGGVLQGEVNVEVGKGIAGLIGRRISKKLNIPHAGTNELVVTISHDEKYLHWNRQFNIAKVMESRFKPIGTIDNGYWQEQTGPVQMMLTVAIKNNGWYWRCLQIKYRGVPIPLWLFPDMEAYKYINDGDYVFYVGFRVPLLGKLLSYHGNLKLVDQP